MNAQEAIFEMERLLVGAQGEGRSFTDAEEARFNELRSVARAAMPGSATRPVAGAVRCLSDAVRAENLVLRMAQNGTARVEVPMDIRALGSDQALSPDPGYAVPPSNLGPRLTHYGEQNRLLTALASVPVTGNAVTYTRVRYSASGGGGNKAAKVQELAAKPESTIATEEITQGLDTYAHWLPCSRQVLDDVSGLRALLDILLVRGLLDKTDTAVFAEMTTSGRFVAYTPTSGDTIGDAMARVATTLASAGASGVKIAANPTTILNMALQKASGSGQYLGLPSRIEGEIVPVAAVPVGKLLAWADTGAVWASREGVSVQAGLNNDDFTKNKITLLCEHRGAVLTLDPAHVRYGDATA